MFVVCQLFSLVSDVVLFLIGRAVWPLFVLALSPVVDHSLLCDFRVRFTSHQTRKIGHAVWLPGALGSGLG